MSHCDELAKKCTLKRGTRGDQVLTKLDSLGNLNIFKFNFRLILIISSFPTMPIANTKRVFPVRTTWWAHFNVQSLPFKPLCTINSGQSVIFCSRCYYCSAANILLQSPRRVIFSPLMHFVDVVTRFVCSVNCTTLVGTGNFLVWFDLNMMHSCHFFFRVLVETLYFFVKVNTFFVKRTFFYFFVFMLVLKIKSETTNSYHIIHSY